MKRMPYLQPINIDGVTGFEARFTQPTTVKDVLLDRWAKDTREMAIARIQLDTASGECTIDHDGRTVYYQTYNEALAGEIDYLNSPAEVEK